MRFINQDREFSGEYEDHVFRVPASAKIIKVNDPEGWAIPEAIDSHLWLLNCQQIVITDRDDSNIVHVVDYEVFHNHAQPIERGLGYELVLPIKYWQTKNLTNQDS